MKNLTKKQMIVLCLALCMAVALLTGVLLADVTDSRAYAETAAEDLYYSLNSAGTAYSVSAYNKQLTQAEIPETYNGLPVTEIANNAFSGCANLVKVTVPQSILRIGNNAFFNCKNLTTILGMAKVTTIGNNAFAMSPNLNNLVLPSTIESLGSYILRNNPNAVYSRLSKARMAELNTSWDKNISAEAQVIYGNETVYEPVTENGEVVAYEIREWQLYAPEDNFIVPSSYNDLPVINIQSCAFSIFECNELTIKHLPGFDHTVNVSSDAFSGMFANSVNIEVDITLVDKDTNSLSTGVFASSMIQSVKLPDSLSVIPDEMFSDCMLLNQILNTNLYIGKNHLSNKITAIGSNAFKNCSALEDIYIPSSVTSIGQDAFHMWGTCELDQKIYIDRYVPASTWNRLWKGTQGSNVCIEYNKNVVVFAPDNGIVGTSYVEVGYGQRMPNASAAVRENYTFNGYYTEKNGLGVRYYAPDMSSDVIWSKEEPIILYAYWTPQTFTVILDKQNGVGGTDSIIAACDQPMPNAEAPQKVGYDFEGYYSLPNGDGMQYYDSKMTSSHDYNYTNVSTLYAHWTNQEHVLIFDKDGGVGGTTFTAVTYNQPLPANLDAPTKESHTFQGYYSETGVQYFDKDMVPVVNAWNIAEDTVLTANWDLKSTTVIYKLQNGEEDLELHVVVGYPVSMPMGTIDKRGYTFAGFYDDPEYGMQYIDQNYTSTMPCMTEGVLTLYAHWTMTVYTIEYLGVDPTRNPNPTMYTIADLENGPLVFADVTDCGPGQVCEWVPSQIGINELSTVTVSCTIRDKTLSETKVVENGQIKYYIYTPTQFLDMNSEETEMGANVTFYLEENIHFSWFTNGYISREFIGTFDGQGHSITGIEIVRDFYEPGNAGLFECNGVNSVIRNLRIFGTMNISGSMECNAGLLCGLNKGSIENCVVLGASSGSPQEYDVTNTNRNAVVGAIVGSNTDTGVVVDCISSVRFKPEE